MTQFLILLIGYFVGAILQTSFWIGKHHNIDIRTKGSGNSGTTNMMRTMGKKAGMLTGAIDLSKVFLTDLICWLIFANTGMPIILIFLYAGLGTVIGHIFPFFMRFKGGKGVATLCGVMISLFFLPTNLWIMTVIGFVVFFGSLYLFKYMSLTSLMISSSFLIMIIIWGAIGALNVNGQNLAQAIIIVAIMVAIVFVKHSGNISRLLNGTERKFTSKKTQD